jgi:hypothetical protein
MGSVIFAAYAAAYLVLGVLLLRTLQQDSWRFSISTLLLCLLIPALVYENSVLALGIAVGVGETLEALNRARFVLHAFFGGALAIIAADVWQRLDPSQPKRHLTTNVAVGFAILTALAGTPHYLAIPMQSVSLAGVLRYTATASSPLGPAPIIISTLVCLIVGVVVWRHLKNPALAIGSAAVLLGHAGPSQVVFFTGNLSEIIFVAGLLTVEQQVRMRHASRSSFRAYWAKEAL